MKIGLFGNTNNSMFVMAETLRALGHETSLILTEKELLHRPEGCAPELAAGYPDWIVDASDLQELDYFVLSPGVKTVIDLLASCDVLFLNHVGPSLLTWLDRPAIAFLTGSDLDHYADPAMIDARTQAWEPQYKVSGEGQGYIRLLEAFVRRQRRGIQNAIAVRYFPRGLIHVGDRLLDELGVLDDRRIAIPAVDLARVRPAPAPHNQPVRIFYATRFTWKLPIEAGRSTLDYKGSDIMIRGLGLFHRATGARLDIQFVNKGLHVEETKALIAEEGLADQVTWSDEMPLSAIREQFASSDIIFEQLAGSIVAGAGLDAMATARPVIGNVQPKLFEAYLGKMPICQAKTPEEVSAQLQCLVLDPKARERIGIAGRQFVEEHFSPVHLMKACLQRFEEAAVSHRAGKRARLS